MIDLLSHALCLSLKAFILFFRLFTWFYNFFLLSRHSGIHILNEFMNSVKRYWYFYFLLLLNIGPKRCFSLFLRDVENNAQILVFWLSKWRSIWSRRSISRKSHRKSNCGRNHGQNHFKLRKLWSSVSLIPSGYLVSLPPRCIKVGCSSLCCAKNH